jgi:hypothetical protein
MEMAIGKSKLDDLAQWDGLRAGPREATDPSASSSRA